MNGRFARSALGLAACAAVAAGALLVGRHLYLGAKGAAAAVLIDRAWGRSFDDGHPHRPWPWADFTPVARIEVRRLGIDRPVLSDAGGRTMAFGLGHLIGSAPLGGRGLSAIGGHRDTWAAFLADLQRGDTIVLRTFDGVRRYRVTDTTVADRHAALPAAYAWGADAAGDAAALGDSAAADRLVLVTCWPFNAIRRGPLRYIVTCVAETPPSAARPAIAPDLPQRVDDPDAATTNGISMKLVLPGA
jgi:sortase A